jgi:hypothetical protein
LPRRDSEFRTIVHASADERIKAWMYDNPVHAVHSVARNFSEVPEQGWEPRSWLGVGDWVRMGVSGLREAVEGSYGVLSVSHLSVI